VRTVEETLPVRSCS